MNTTDKFLNLSGEATLQSVFKSTMERTGKELNCVRIGIIQEFYPEDLTAKVLISNKKDLGQNTDGTQNFRDFALVRAKVCYCNPFVTYPLTQGMECVLLFNDREIESWFVNGGVNPLAYPRMHALTDCIALCGIRSIPQIISILADCLNLFYGNSNIAISNDLINITSGTVQASNLQAMNGASGNIVDSQGKTLAKVEHGIITEIY